MGWVQITILALHGIALLAAAHLHGKRREGNHNFWTTFAGTVLVIGLLVIGGFFG